MKKILVLFLIIIAIFLVYKYIGGAKEEVYPVELQPIVLWVERGEALVEKYEKELKEASSSDRMRLLAELDTELRTNFSAPVTVPFDPKYGDQAKKLQERVSALQPRLQKLYMEGVSLGGR